MVQKKPEEAYPTENRPGVTQHFWGVMSDGDELPKFTPGYADAFFGVDTSGCPASGGGGRTAAPAAAMAPGAATTPALSFPAVDPTTPALARGTPAAAAAYVARSAAVAAGTGAVVCASTGGQQRRQRPQESIVLSFLRLCAHKCLYLKASSIFFTILGVITHFSCTQLRLILVSTVPVAAWLTIAVICHPSGCRTFVRIFKRL